MQAKPVGVGGYGRRNRRSDCLDEFRSIFAAAEDLIPAPTREQLAAAY